MILLLFVPMIQLMMWNFVKQAISCLLSQIQSLQNKEYFINWLLPLWAKYGAHWYNFERSSKRFQILLRESFKILPICGGTTLFEMKKKENSQETIKRASIKARATDYLEPKPILPKIDKLHQLLPMWVKLRWIFFSPTNPKPSSKFDIQDI